MSDDLVKFLLPTDFILARVVPNPSEMIYGYQRGWLNDEGAVRVAEAELAAGMRLPDAVEELALLLGDEAVRVAELVTLAIEELPSDEKASRIWLYLALDWLHEHRADFVEPLEVIEMLYADFDYPSEIEGLIRFMPPPPGAVVGHEGIMQRWRNYLMQMAVEYSERWSSPS